MASACERRRRETPESESLAAAVAAVVLLTVVTVSAVLAHMAALGVAAESRTSRPRLKSKPASARKTCEPGWQSGESIADVIGAEGGELEAVVTAALTGLDEKVEALVEAGRLQSDEVEDYKAAAEQRVRDWLAGTKDGFRGKSRGRLGGKGHGLVTIVSEQTDVLVEDIRAKLADGESLADIVEESEGDLTAVTDAAMAAFETRLTTAIVNGRVSSEQADELRQSTRERIEAALQADGGPTCNGTRQVRLPRLGSRARSISRRRQGRFG